MIYRKLGRTGLDCSALGFGTWQIGGSRWKGMSDSESVDLLQYALEKGINVFDAAVVYGQYRGEHHELISRSLELLGTAFKSKRSNGVICLKIGQLDEYSHKAIMTAANLVAQFQQALKTLKTDFVDICLIHAPSINEIREQRALAVLQTLQTMGHVRFIGYSFESELEHVRLALQQEIDVIMLQYNLIDLACDPVFREAEMAGIGIIVGGPFKRGYLTGKYEKISDLPLEDDYWQWNINHSRCKVLKTLDHVVTLKAKWGGAENLRRAALREILRHRGACSTVVGLRSKVEIDENHQNVINSIY